MTGALDTPLAVTTFPDVAAHTLTAETLTLRQLAARAGNTHARVKADLPLVKLARFGDARTVRGGSLRHNANVLSVAGVEADYDGGQVTPEQAAATLRSAGLAGLVYTSPSHTAAVPRWRVLAPLSRPHAPADRAELVARLNGALGGVLAGESFTLSQSFYIGCADHNPDHACVLVDGACLDAVPGLAPVYPARADVPALVLPTLPHGTPPDERAAAALRAAEVAFDNPGGDTGRHGVLLAATNAVAPYVLSGHLDPDEACEALASGMSSSGRDPNPGEVESALAGALRLARPYEPPTYGAEFDALPPAPVANRGRRFYSDAPAAGGRGYVVKHLIAPGDVCALLGQPGAGKSTLAPHIAYAVAQGRPVFGLRTKPGRTLYAAAEDVSGFRQRLHALGQEHGHTRDCAGVECGNLREPAERAALLAEVADFAPALFILDTLGAAFAGMDENAPGDMGEVVAFARTVAAKGCAVLLIHHPAKAGDGTPRGHSVLNGTLDMVLTLAPGDEGDADAAVSGRLLKNRNGTTARRFAFRRRVVELGRDDDGDPITTTLPVEADAQAGQRRTTLAPQQAKALQALRDTLAGPEALQQDGRTVVPESAWRAVCDTRSLSASDNPDSHGRTFRRAAGDLAAAGYVGRAGGVVWLTDGPDEFTSLSPDKTDSVRVRPGLSACPPVQPGPDGQDKPLKGCPSVRPGTPPHDLTLMELVQ